MWVFSSSRPMTKWRHATTFVDVSRGAFFLHCEAGSVSDGYEFGTPPRKTCRGGETSRPNIQGNSVPSGFVQRVRHNVMLKHVEITLTDDGIRHDFFRWFWATSTRRRSRKIVVLDEPVKRRERHNLFSRWSLYISTRIDHGTFVDCLGAFYCRRPFLQQSTQRRCFFGTLLTAWLLRPFFSYEFPPAITAHNHVLVELMLPWISTNKVAVLVRRSPGDSDTIASRAGIGAESSAPREATGASRRLRENDGRPVLIMRINESDRGPIQRNCNDNKYGAHYQPRLLHLHCDRNLFGIHRLFVPEETTTAGAAATKNRRPVRQQQQQ
jgi:hypothetical protein